MIPLWIKVLIISMLPFSELRGGIPYGVAVGLPFWQVWLIAVIGNFIPVPFILLFLQPIEKLARKWSFFDRIIDRVFEYTRRKTRKSIERWESIALILFVAIPLPVTGAWTGSLAAYLFGLEFKKSIICIFVGILIASLIVAMATFAGIKFLGM